jgi:sphingomyelin phosphodiesterase acid-like 3
MNRRKVKLLLLFLSLTFPLAMSGCGGDSTRNNYRVVVLSDIHFDPFYDPALFAALDGADASQWEAIFKASTVTLPTTWGKDTNYPLLILTLASVRQHLGDAPLVLFTGDLLGHYIPQLYYKAINGTNAPRDAADVAAMKAFTIKTLTFVMNQIRSSCGAVPVLFALGNGDSYTGAVADAGFLADSAELFYGTFLNGATGHQPFLDTFTAGGYYAAQPLGAGLTVIGLNTILFSPLIPGTAAAVAAELAWFDATLAAARDRGDKVWLLMHAPPGVDLATTASHADAAGHVTAATATMIWDQGYQTSFLQTLAKYPGLVTLTLGAHTHKDEFRIMAPGQVLEVVPSISPCFGNNPAYKIFTFAGGTQRSIDFSSLNYDLATTPAQFNPYYTFSQAYASQGFLDDSLAQLFPALATDGAKQALYRGFYYSGHNAPVAVTDLYANPITDTNWPIFWSGIGYMEQAGFIGGVNNY